MHNKIKKIEDPILKDNVNFISLIGLILKSLKIKKLSIYVHIGINVLGNQLQSSLCYMD